MRTLLTALCRKLYRPRPSSEGSLVVYGPHEVRPCEETFTVGDQTGGVVVEALTLNCERIDDAAWLEMICRLRKVRFVAPEDPQSPHSGDGGTDDPSSLS